MSAEEERARDLITEANEQTDVEEAAVHVSEAQVHATLALVEQQRIANLIAVADLAEKQYRATDSHPDLYDPATRPASIARHDEALRQVREGLGLS